jgi:hypothetical protein
MYFRGELLKNYFGGNLLSVRGKFKKMKSLRFLK